MVYSRGKWKMLETELDPATDCVVFAGHALGWLTAGEYRPLLHGVRTIAKRLSLVFFLRAPDGNKLERGGDQFTAGQRPCLAILNGLHSSPVSDAHAGGSGK